MIEFIKDAVEQIGHLPSTLLLMLVIIVIGYMLRLIKKFPNDAIPFVCVLLGAVGNLFMRDRSDAISTVAYPKINLLAIGIIIGFLAWVLHRFAIQKLEDWLKTKLGIGLPDGGPVVPPTPPIP